MWARTTHRNARHTAVWHRVGPVDYHPRVLRLRCRAAVLRREHSEQRSTEPPGPLCTRCLGPVPAAAAEAPHA